MSFTRLTDAQNTYLNAGVSTDDFGKSVSLSVFDAKRIGITPERKRVLDANFAFLTSELAKLNPELIEPISYFTYAEDIKMDVGGGFVDFVEFRRVDYAGIVKTALNLFGNAGNIIPRVNAGATQEKVPVFTYEIAYDLRWVDLEKMKQIHLQKSIQQIYEDEIMVGWSYFCQTLAYTGIEGVTGLFNSTNVPVTVIDNTGTDDKGFSGLDDDFVVAFFNGLFMSCLSGSNMNINLLPTRILVPTFVLSDLANRFSALYSNSLYDFIKEHNVAKIQGGDKYKVTIVARDGLDDLGTFSKGRIVAYRDEKKYVRMDVTHPISLYMTLPSIERAAYTSIFIGQVSQVQMPYNVNSTEMGVVSYWDFKA